MQFAIAGFTVHLVFGTAAMLCLMPRKDVPSPFFRIMMLFLMGLGVLFGLTTDGSRWGAVFIAVAGFVGSTLWLLERRQAGTVAVFLIASASLAELGWGCWRANETLPNAPLWLVGLSSLSSAGTLGAAMTGMLLGHRYLTAPGMPLAPLLRLNDLLGTAAAVRLALSAIGLAFAASHIPETFYWVWIALRWLAGIIGPLVVWWMVKRILRYRNTQSATGVLFVAVILTFIGELTADLLLRALQAVL